MENADIQKLVDSIIDKMKSEHHIFWVDPEIHPAQHGFIKILMEEREERRLRSQRIKEKIAGSLILSASLALVGLIGAGALDWLRQHIK